MGKRLAQVLVLIVFLGLLIFVGVQQSKPYETEEISKVEDVYISNAPITLSEEMKRAVVVNENETALLEKMGLINEKYQMVKSLVPADYEQLNALEKEIEKLNDTISANTRNISTADDINESTLQSLDDVSAALDIIIEAFSPTPEPMAE